MRQLFYRSFIVVNVLIITVNVSVDARSNHSLAACVETFWGSKSLAAGMRVELWKQGRP
jgi:hypothetical protein